MGSLQADVVATMIRIISPSFWRALPFILILALSACGSDSDPSPSSSPNNTTRPGSGNNDVIPRVNDTVTCAEAPNFFTSNVWPEIQSQCISCHTSKGSGGASNFVLYKDQAQATPDNVSDFMATNFERFKTAAAIPDGNSLAILVKPLSTTHGGGVRYTDSTNAGYQRLVTLAKSLAQCALANPGADKSIKLADSYQSLRKAIFALAGRLPTEQEEAVVRVVTTEAALQTELNKIFEPHPATQE